MESVGTDDGERRIASSFCPARELTWRLVAGQGARYGPAWGNGGRDVIRDSFSRLYLLASGRIRIETDARTYVLRPGELWLIPGAVPARYACVEPTELSWVHFNVFVVPEVDLLSGAGPVAMPADRASAVRFEAMLGSMRGRGPSDLAMALACLGDLVAPFFPSDWDTLAPELTASGRLRPALDAIASGYGGDCSVPTLARRVHLHPVYFTRLFTRTVGMPPARYVAEVRMRVASIRLVTTQDPIAVIGAACGYPDPYHFSRAFKRHVGLSPRAYRAAQA